MKRMLLAAGLTTALLASSGAEAAGCLKGAAVGGVAGHLAGHHGVLGALAGCAIGHHRAAAERRREREQVRPAPNDQDESQLRM